jgi:hypothetical protein
LAPFRFTIIIDYILSKVLKTYGFITYTDTNDKINTLACVDDVVIISKSTKATKRFNKILNEDYKNGLKINLNKTKIMTNIPHL